MRRSRPSLLLTEPTRFAGVSQGRARMILAVLAAVIAAALMAVWTAPGIADGSSATQTDGVLYDTIVEGIRHGGAYYAVAADAMRSGGYPLKPFVTMRLPTLAMVEAHLPPVLMLTLLWALVAMTAVAWYARIAPSLAALPTRVAAMVLVLGGAAASLQPDLVVFHEIWAGLLIALSLATWRPGRWIDAVALGLAAALIRETAALYLVLMGALAIRDGDRRQAIAWASAVGMLAVVLACHAHAVAAAIRPLDPSSPGWMGMLGIGFAAHALMLATALTIVPAGLAAPVTVLTLLGWIAWRGALGLRVAATLSAYALLLATAARADTLYWVLLVAPLWLAGLVFAVDALRDLVHAALDSRRITVTRVVR